MPEQTELEAWVVPATLSHVEHLLHEGLRKADVQELEAMGLCPEAALRQSFEGSLPHAYTIMVAGTPAGMFGVDPDGWVWLLGTDRLLRARERFLAQTNAWVAHLNRIAPTMGNLVDLRNAASVRWLEKAGFEFHECHEIGGTTFRRFSRCAPH